MPLFGSTWKNLYIINSRVVASCKHSLPSQKNEVMKTLVKMTLLVCHRSEDIASFIHVPTRTDNYLSSTNNLFSRDVTPDPPSCNNNDSILAYERRFFNRFAFLALRCCENIYGDLNINQLIRIPRACSLFVKLSSMFLPRAILFYMYLLVFHQIF